jgi:hypothetical protein
VTDDLRMLGYATAASPSCGRTSRLAVGALVVVALSCPWFTSLIKDRIGLRTPAEARLATALTYAAMVVATGLASAALVRVRRSRGRLRGAGIASTALGVSLWWWACVGAANAAVRLIIGPE